MSDNERVAISCDDCGKVMLRPKKEELGSPEIIKRIEDVQNWHNGRCWKKEALKKASNHYQPRKTTY